MIEKLLEYQSADAGLRKIETELAGSEARKKAVIAKKYLESVEENVNVLDARAAKLVEVYEKAIEEQEKLEEFQTEFESAVKEATTASEASYLIKKVDEVSLKIKSLTAKLVKLSEEIASIKKEYANIRNTTKAMQTQYSENTAKYGELKASLKQEKESVEKKLEELKKDVEPALMERYLKKRSAKMYPVVYEANGKACGACNMELAMSDVGKLKSGEVIECPQCGRLLYEKK